MAKSTSSRNPSAAQARLTRLTRKIQSTTRQNAAAIRAASRKAALQDAREFKAAALKAAQKFAASYAAAGEKIARLKIAQLRAEAKRGSGLVELKGAHAEIATIMAAATRALSQNVSKRMSDLLRTQPLGQGPRDRGRPPSNHGRDRNRNDAGDEHSDGLDD